MEVKTCYDCQLLKDRGDHWLCRYYGDTTVNPDRYDANDCSEFKEAR